ncbi:hypothetical protein [Acinetobacter calcoaceticus]|uniref:hypothetical protein n=1 Tax=Acinetobacter calcoaceticus TaxID=471 RepID=UPI0005E9CEFF|nr:hypothetical protein [Acinetobacter calcoaceticus]KJH56951.1 hypothetical protein UF12_13690 [Acinetobacter calcoaceticus]
MTNKIHDTALSLLNGSLRHIRTMIDKGDDTKYILADLRELQAKADFAKDLGIISDDEHQEIKEKWYHYRELLDVINQK